VVLPPVLPMLPLVVPMLPLVVPVLVVTPLVWLPVVPAPVLPVAPEVVTVVPTPLELERFAPLVVARAVVDPLSVVPEVVEPVEAAPVVPPPVDPDAPTELDAAEVDGEVAGVPFAKQTPASEQSYPEPQSDGWAQVSTPFGRPFKAQPDRASAAARATRLTTG
jgi:hypothetical protein